MTQHTLDAIPSPAPIFGMPVDIILVIFDILRQSCGSNFKMNMYNSSTLFDVALRWVPEVTHVCHSWREAALLASFLWTDIDFEASISWAVEFARRSRQAPINIILEPDLIRYQDRSPELYKCIQTLLRENRHRIREIHLCDVEDENIIISTLSGDTDTGTGSAFFPILESLEISIDTYDDDEPTLFLTNDILRAPNLKELSLNCGSVEEDFESFHNISCLSIRKHAVGGSDTPNFLRRALPEMLKLEKLSLRASDDFNNVSAIDFGIQLATLPKLCDIEIDYWPIEWIVSILQMISYGPRRKVRVAAVLDLDRLEEVLQLFTCFMSHAGSSTPRLGLLYNTSRLRVWDLRESVTPPDLRFSIEFPTPLDYFPQRSVDPTLFLLGGLLRRLNHRDLRALVLGVTLSSQSWVKIFGTIPSLTRIRIYRGERNFFAALINEIGPEDAPVQQPEHTNATATALPFRGLRAVRIAGRKEPYPEKDMAFILKCLQVRKERGYKLRKLHFTSFAREELKLQLNGLKDLVGSLEVR